MREPTGIREGFGPEFEILRELGRGGVSVVYLARDRMLGRQVAIKVIDDRYVGDTEALARFRREARLLAQLQHPNIVPVYSARRLPDGRVALVMQHMAGPTLREQLRREGSFSCERAEQVLADMAEALVYLHRRGIVHRDVKPENIYLDVDGGHAFLSDFGIAKPVDADSGLTLSGVVLGTPTYMSPEQVDGAWLNGQSDVYSLGLVGWEMLTGRRPWGGEALYTVIYKQKTEYLPPLEQLRPGVPERLREAVERALLKDRALRWANADAFLQHLRGTSTAVVLARPEPMRMHPAPPLEVDDLPTQVIRPSQVADEVWRETASAARERARRRRRRVVAAAVGVALAIGGATAAAAVFARMRGEDGFASFSAPHLPAPGETPEGVPPAHRPATPPPATVSPVESPVEPSSGSVADSAAPRPGASGRAREESRSPAARTTPAAPRQKQASRPERRPEPSGRTSRASTPSRGESRLLGSPVSESVRPVRTELARTVSESRVASRKTVVIP